MHGFRGERTLMRIFVGESLVTGTACAVIVDYVVRRPRH
jgi:hypothetical protein